MEYARPTGCNTAARGPIVSPTMMPPQAPPSIQIGRFADSDRPDPEWADWAADPLWVMTSCAGCQQVAATDGRQPQALFPRSLVDFLRRTWASMPPLPRPWAFCHSPDLNKAPIPRLILAGMRTSVRQCGYVAPSRRSQSLAPERVLLRLAAQAHRPDGILAALEYGSVRTPAYLP